MSEIEQTPADEAPESIELVEILELVEIVVVSSEHPFPIPFSVNGISAPLPFAGKPFEFPAYFLGSLDAVDGVVYRLASEPGPGAQSPEQVLATLNSEAFPDFDPEAIIAGNVDDVLPLLESMTAAQLESLRSAEKDREQPRKGITNAIDKAIAAAS